MTTSESIAMFGVVVALCNLGLSFKLQAIAEAIDRLAKVIKSTQKASGREE